jgi:thymidylate synthase
MASTRSPGLFREIETNPNSRRLIVTGWNPATCDEVALPPCHTLFQFKVENERTCIASFTSGRRMRSSASRSISAACAADTFVAHVCGLEVGDFIHTFGDLHIYQNHLEQVNELLSRNRWRCLNWSWLMLRVCEGSRPAQFQILRI